MWIPMTAGLPSSRTTARTTAPPSPSKESAQSPGTAALSVLVRGSYDSNAQLRFRCSRGSRAAGGACAQRGAVCAQPVLLDDADGARADRPARAAAFSFLREPLLRGRARALSSAHGLLR